MHRTQLSGRDEIINQINGLADLFHNGCYANVRSNREREQASVCCYPVPHPTPEGCIDIPRVPRSGDVSRETNADQTMNEYGSVDVHTGNEPYTS